MIMNFLRKIIENRKITFFFIFALLLAGLYSYWLMPKQENPQITPPVAHVSVIYPGASPEDMEETVTTKLEDKISSIEGIDYIESYSQNSYSAVIVWLATGTDVNKSWDDLRKKMDDVQAELPDNAHKVQIDTDMDRTAGFIISFSGENYSFEQLEWYAENIKKRLEGVKGVSAAEINGQQKDRVEIRVNNARLNQLNLSLADILQTLQAQNVLIPGGDISDGKTKIPVSTPGHFKDIKEIENLVIGLSEESGNFLQLRDVAEISIGPEEDLPRYYYNGQEAVFLTGYFLENNNVLIVEKDLKKILVQIEEDLPGDLQMDFVLNQPQEIRKSVNNLMLNLLEGMLFVTLVVFIGIGFRNSLVVALAIPFSIIMSFSVMNFIGLQVHQISIAGFIIALGMLVDNAIVISDSIQLRIDAGEDRLEACLAGVRDVALPVFTATATTVVAYVPLLTLSGIAGEYVRSVPQIVIITLIASYLTAIFFTPLMAYLYFQKSSERNYGDKLMIAFKNMSFWGMANKKKVIYLALAAMVFSLIVAFLLPLVFFPKADKNIVYVNIKSEEAVDLNRTDQLTKYVDEIIRSQPETVYTAAASGEGLPKFFITLPGFIKAPDTGQLMISLDLKKGKRFRSNTEFVEEMQSFFDKNVSSGAVTVKELEQAEPSEAPIIVRLTGPDKEELKNTSVYIQGLLEEIPGTFKVTDDAQDKRYQYKVDIDTVKASAYGLTHYDIQNEINIALNGRSISGLKKDDSGKYDILVKGNLRDIEDLQNMQIKSSITGQKILLRNVATISAESQLPVIKRYNRENSINVLSDVRLGYSAVDIQNSLQAEIKASEFDKDITISYAGEKDNIIKYFGGLGLAAIFAFMGIYIIMMLQFNSMMQPLIIMISIPFSIIGSALGLFIFRQPLSFTALLGVVSLLGVVINNAIILLDYINAERREGIGLEDACKSAVEKRVRPILLTTITTILGLIPLIFSGTLFVPMAVALMSGLAVSTLLTLVIVPVVYSLVYEKREELNDQAADGRA